jgi:hypothetical protein
MGALLFFGCLPAEFLSCEFLLKNQLEMVPSRIYEISSELKIQGEEQGSLAFWEEGCVCKAQKIHS